MVHRLVAEAFLGPCPPGHEVSHKNGDGCDNRAENLEYLTHRENIAEKKIHGTENLGERNHFARLTAAQVLEIRAISELEGSSEAMLAAEYDVHPVTIQRILTRETWKHL